MMLQPEQLAGRTEHSQQVALFQQCALHFDKYPQLKLMFAIPNANSHKMVSEGVRGSVPDIFLPYSIYEFGKNTYHGLFIELKIESRRIEKNGGCSNDQLKWLAALENAGYFCAVCYGWQDAWRVIEEYLNG